MTSIFKKETCANDLGKSYNFTKELYFSCVFSGERFQCWVDEYGWEMRLLSFGLLGPGQHKQQPTRLVRWF